MEEQAKQLFEAWRDRDGIAFGTRASIAEQRSRGLLTNSAEHLYSFEAHSWEEAMAVHHLRMGFEPYEPQGEPVPCPNCGALVYAQGSGQCWRCGQVTHGA
jgi:hypothetical protein